MQLWSIRRQNRQSDFESNIFIPENGKRLNEMFTRMSWTNYIHSGVLHDLLMNGADNNMFKCEKNMHLSRAGILNFLYVPRRAEFCHSPDYLENRIFEGHQIRLVTEGERHHDRIVTRQRHIGGATHRPVGVDPSKTQL